LLLTPYSLFFRAYKALFSFPFHFFCDILCPIKAFDIFERILSLIRLFVIPAKAGIQILKELIPQQVRNDKLSNLLEQPKSKF